MLGRGLPSVWLRSYVETTLKCGTRMTVSSPSFSMVFLYGAGAMTLIPFSPFLTCRPNFFQDWNPASLVAPGHCKAIRRVLLKL